MSLPSRPLARLALLALVLGVLGLAAVTAQDDAARAKILDRTPAVGVEARVRAATGVGEKGTLADLEWLWEALAECTIYEMNKSRALERTEEQIDEIEWRNRGKNAMPPRAEKRLEKLRGEKKNLAKAADAEKAVTNATREAIASIFARAKEGERRAAIKPFIDEFSKTDKSYRQVMIARTLGHLDDSVARHTLLKAIETDDALVRVAIGEALGRQADIAGEQKKGGLEGAFWTKSFSALTRVLQKSRKTLKKLQTNYEKYGKRFNRSTLKSNKPSLTKKEQSLDSKRHEAGRALADEESVVEQYAKTLENVFTRFSDAARTEATAPLVERLAKASKPEDKVFLIELLGPFKAPAIRTAIAPLIDDRAPEVRMAVCDALGKQRDPKGAEALGRAIVDPYWQVRVAAVDALKKVGGRGAVDALIIGIGKAEGRIVHDISEALVQLTGKNFHENRVLWRDWWSESRSAYKGPPAVAKADKKDGGAAGGKPSPNAPKDGVSFYGILTRSKNIVYILDVSGSMNFALHSYMEAGAIPKEAPVGERKIDEAITELKRSITSLPKDASFNIVFYSHEVDVWKKKQVEASDANKEKAIKWADSVKAVGATNVFDAVERAFGLAGRGTHDKQYAIAADTFYLLSDGRSNRGRVIDADAMIAEIKRLNKFQRVVIHTVGLGLDCDRDFMRDLAEQSGGNSTLITTRRAK